MPKLSSYDYAVVRVVPSLERGEFVNAGIVLYARSDGFLAARVGLDEARLARLDPAVDPTDVTAHLAVVDRICRGGPGAGPIGQLGQSQRFHWLVSPRSTVIQMSAVHSGLCDEPRRELDRLFERLVDASA